MSDIEREPCPRCGEPAAVSASLCPQCRGSLLVDVVLDASPADPRARYQTARAIAALGPPAPSFMAAQQIVGLPGSVLAAGVNREIAGALRAIFTEHGGAIRTTPHRIEEAGSAPPRAGGTPWWKVAVAVLAAAALGAYGWSRFSAAPETASVEVPLADRAPHPAGPPITTRELAATATPSTVKLRCAESEGSGFFVAEDLLLTNAHVLCPEGGAIRVLFENGRELDGVAERKDDWLDIATVRVPGAGARPLPLGDALDLRTGDRVVFIGAPEGLDFTVHEGIVSHAMRSILGVGYLQIDASVNPGNSGGPLFDPQGRVVGIVSAKVMGSEGLGFALPINYAHEGSPPVLPASPATPGTGSAWKDVLAKIAAADQREVKTMESESARPALIGLTVVPGSGPAAVVLRIAHDMPLSETLFFTFRTPDRVVCKASGGVRFWQRMNDGSAAGSDSRYLRWLQKHGLAQDVYQGLAILDLTGCPRDDLREAEVVLDGGDERAGRSGL